MKFPLDGPHFPRRPRRFFGESVAMLLCFVLIAVFLLMMIVGIWTAIKGNSAKTRGDIEYPEWLPKENAIRLEKYHGEGHLKITEVDASILRKGEWIVVARRNQ
jgi:hypothetical protein